MGEKFARSWMLTKQSWAVLREDKHLMLFPIISGIAILLLMIVSLGGGGAILWSTGAFETAGSQADQQQHLNNVLHSPVAYAALFVFYFVSNFVVIYFNAALVSCVINRFRGVESGFGAGLRAANARLPKILAWAALNATVGMIMKIAEERLGWIGRLILRGIAFAWNIATFFVVPVLVVDNVGPIDAVKKSVEVLKKSWGESLIVQTGVGLVMGLLTIGVLLLGVGAAVGVGVLTQSVGLAFIPVAVMLVVMTALVLISTTMRSILVAACYQYATTGQAPDAFAADSLQAMFGVKRKK